MSIRIPVGKSAAEVVGLEGRDDKGEAAPYNNGDQGYIECASNSESRELIFVRFKDGRLFHVESRYLRVIDIPGTSGSISDRDT